jgi:tetratricopeptide (TPR) repeat protein
MAKKQIEYLDKDHKVMSDFYDLCEIHDGSNTLSVKRQLENLIKKDPDYLDPYLFLREILQEKSNSGEAEKLLDDAYRRAIELITDKKGNWPDILEWAYLENRHIIRTILNKALSLWENEETDDALELFRKLLKTNPGDNVGARDYILAIRMDMSFEDFERRFNKGGFYDNEMINWFEKNYKKFPDEFDWWEKAVEKYM